MCVSVCVCAHACVCVCLCEAMEEVEDQKNNIPAHNDVSFPFKWLDAFLCPGILYFFQGLGFSKQEGH